LCGYQELPICRFKGARPVHANDDLRESFLEAIGAYRRWQPGQPEPFILSEGAEWPVSKLCEDMIGCADIMPPHACRDLGVADGSTYDEGAKAFQKMIEAARSRQ
jgi:hypothetical protein